MGRGSSGASWELATTGVAGRIGEPIPADPKGAAMSATITAPAQAGSSPVNTLKVVLAALAIVALLALAFVVGRITSSSSSSPASVTPAPAAAPAAPASGATPTTCRMGRPC